MDIQQLRYVWHAAQAGSFSAAANTLFVTRAAIGKSISQLELELGYPLFDRERDGVSLTESGKQHLPAIEDLLAHFDRLDAAMKRERTMRTIDVGVPNSWFEHFSPALRAFQSERAQEVRLNITTCSDAELVRRLNAGEISLGITHLPLQDTLDAGRCVLRTPLYIAMSTNNPLAQKEFIVGEDLRDQVVYFYACGFDKVFWVPTPGGRIQHFENDLMFIYARVHQNEGVLPTPLYTTPEFQQGIVCLPFVGEHSSIETYCYIARSVQTDPRLKVLCLQLREHLEHFT